MYTYMQECAMHKTKIVPSILQALADNDDFLYKGKGTISCGVYTGTGTSSRTITLVADKKIEAIIIIVRVPSIYAADTTYLGAKHVTIGIRGTIRGTVTIYGNRNLPAPHNSGGMLSGWLDMGQADNGKITLNSYNNVPLLNLGDRSYYWAIWTIEK